MKQKACVNRQIMCDYDDSLFARGRLGSHLGGSDGWGRRTLVTNELDSVKKNNRLLNNFLWGQTTRRLSQTKSIFRRRMEVTEWEEAHRVDIFCSAASSGSRLLFRRGLSGFKAAVISHLRWHVLSDGGALKSLRWLIIISKVPCHAADLNKRVWMHLCGWAKRLMS